MSDSDAEAAAAVAFGQRLIAMLIDEINAERLTPVAASVALSQGLGFLVAEQVKPGRMDHALADIVAHITRFAIAYRAASARIA